MRLASIASLAALLVCGALSTGCHRDRAESPAQALSMLQSPKAGDRRDAADTLMDDGGPSPEAVPYLIAALQREQDARTYGVMLLALGKSGSPEARPYLEANLNNSNKSVRERAQQGLEHWSRRNPNGVPNAPPGAMPPGAMPPDAMPPGAMPPPGGDIPEQQPMPPPPPPPPPPPAPPPGQTI